MARRELRDYPVAGVESVGVPVFIARFMKVCGAWLAILMIPAAHGTGHDMGQRQSISLDDHWRFLRGDAPDPMRPRFNDSSWSKVTLPHTYNAEDGERSGGYYRGIGWYRRTIDIPLLSAHRRTYLQFDGAALITDVWINGQHAGRHEGGYAAFRFDVSEMLHTGGNVIAVRVDNSKAPTVAPLGGDFTLFGGLYRSVTLLTTSALHVDPLDCAGPGVYASTTRLNAQEATVNIVTRVRNSESRSLPVQLLTSVQDANGQTVTQLRRTVDVAAHSVQPVVQTVSIHNAHLWNGRSDPYLYRITTQLSDGSSAQPRPTDRVSIPLGIRTIAIDPQRGVLLNGKPYAVHGVDLFHSGRPGRGLAVGNAEIDEDMEILNALGVTGLRLVHFQHPQHTYDDADRMGLLLWTEIPLNSAIDASAAFSANIATQLRELIHQNYNHPSVMVWGLGNEIYKSDAASHHLLAELQHIAHEEDSSRPTTYAHCCSPDDDPQAMQTDVVAYNRYFGWYSGQLSDIGPWADRVHTLLPDRAIAVSEYGAGASILQQEDPPGRPTPASHWHPEQYQALFHEAYWRALRTRPFLWATFVWVAFDVASNGRDEGDRPGINDKGLVSYDRRTRKDAYYWYQANWSSEPMVHITSRRATPRQVASVDIKVYSNTDRVTIRVNGADLTSEAPIDHIALWKSVRLRPGMNHIEAVTNITSRTDSVDWQFTGEPAGGRTRETTYATNTEDNP